MEQLAPILQDRLPTNVLDYEIIPYIYKDFKSVLYKNNLYILQKQIFPFDKTDPNYTNIAATVGYLDVLKWLHTQGAAFDKKVMYRAAIGGYLEVVKWLHAQGIGCTDDAISWAAWGGHLEVIKFLLGKCTADERITRIAVAIRCATKMNHPEIVEYLRKGLGSRSRCPV